MCLIITLPPSPQPIFKLVLNSSYANFTVWAPNAQIRKTVCLFPHIVHVLDIQFAHVLWIRSMYWMLKTQPLETVLSSKNSYIAYTIIVYNLHMHNLFQSFHSIALCLILPILCLLPFPLSFFIFCPILDQYWPVEVTMMVNGHCMPCCT